MNRQTCFPLVTLLLLLAPLLAGFGPPRQQDVAIQITLDAGYGHRYRENMWTPLLLTLSNDGPDVRGELRVRAENNVGLNATTYSTPLELPRQARKQVFLYVSLGSFARQILVELVNEAGEVLAQVDSQLLPASRGDVISAVVTDAPGGSVDLTGIDVGPGESFQVNWPVEAIPPQADALLGVDVMVFSDVDTGRLSVAQQAAIADWVLAGGHLIVSGGPNYRLTTAGLADLLPLTITGTTTVDDLTPLAAFAGRYADSLAEPDVILAVGTLRPGAKVLVQVDGLPVLVRRYYGDGLVDYLAADPNLAPFRRWGDADTLWEALVITPRQVPSWSRGFQDWSLARRVIQQTPGFDLPTTLQMCGMLAVYIAVIGPLNYIVLRVLGRRELAWLTIPVLVIVFSVIAYVTGFNLRGTRATLNRLSVVQVWAEVDRAQVDGLVGLLSPRRSTYQIAASPNLTLRTLPDDSPGAGGFTPMLAATRIEETGLYAAVDVLVDASFVAGFVSSGFADQPPRVSGQATLTYGPGAGARVAGTVTNTTGFRLEDAVVLARGAFQHLGALEPGASVAFSLPLTTRQSAPLSLVHDQSFSAYFDGRDLTAQDVLGPGYSASAYYSPSPTLEERTVRQRQDFLMAIAPDRDFSGGRGDRVFLLGWGGPSPLEITLEGAAWTPEDTTLYIFELPLTVADTDGEVVISPGFSTWMILDETTAFGATPYNLTINGSEQVAFRFMPLPTAQLANVTRLDIMLRRTSFSDASIYLWDWSSQEWAPIPLATGVRTTLRDVDAFVGPGNAVQIMAIPNNVNSAVTYQQFDITWHGTF